MCVAYRQGGGFENPHNMYFTKILNVIKFDINRRNRTELMDFSSKVTVGVSDVHIYMCSL